MKCSSNFFSSELRSKISLKDPILGEFFKTKFSRFVMIFFQDFPLEVQKFFPGKLFKDYCWNFSRVFFLGIASHIQGLSLAFI